MRTDSKARRKNFKEQNKIKAMPKCTKRKKKRNGKNKKENFQNQ